jgi:hypothetical protein
MADPHTIMVTLSNGQMQRILVLMHEYDALRAEIRTQILACFEGFMIITVAIIWLLQTRQDQRNRLSLWVATACSFLALTIMMWSAFGSMHLNAVRLRQIEAQVDKAFGENVLQWETYWGADANGGPLQVLFPTAPKVPDTYDPQ